MNEIDRSALTPAPTAARPLLGLTVLVVEDSRFACEAMRLLCLRSGARIRRADCLRSARRHLQVYRPSVVIIDLGLPDGNGSELILELSSASPRVDVILGTSGDDMNESVAKAAGADGFLSKPLNSLASFQNAVLSSLPTEMRPTGMRSVVDDVISPDPMAFQDDMAHAAEMLTTDADVKTLDYITQFLHGVAQSAQDETLSQATRDFAQARSNGAALHAQTAKLAGMVHERLTANIAI